MLERSLCNKMHTKDKNNLRVLSTQNHNKFSLKDFLQDYGVILSILSAALIIYLAVHDFQKDVDYLSENMATKESVNYINEKYDMLDEKFDAQYKDLMEEFDDLDDNYDDLAKNLEDIQLQDVVYNGSATPTFQKSTLSFLQKDGVYSEQQNKTDNDAEVLWDDEEIICVVDDANHSSSELMGKKLLLSYFYDDQEVYFYGQFSKNMHWDGNCIINIYKNNQLYLITDALYDDGVLKSYQQVFTYYTKASEEVWCISKRECTKDGNVGDSWNYFKSSDIIKNFTIDNVEPYNIYNVAQITKIIKEDLECSIEAYYYGMTSNGLYNDETDNAYAVKFSKEDGTVRTLYFGRFENGVFSDNTGNAWIIGRHVEQIGSTYAFYIGKFKDNKPSEAWTKDNSQNNLSLDDINERIRYKTIKPVLKWYGFDSL